MPEWLSNRLMTPVYALLISFAAALVLGAVMNTPRDQQPPAKTDPAAALTIRLVAKQFGDKGALEDAPPNALQNRQVRVYRAVSDAELAMGNDGVVTLNPVDGPLTVCVSLPQGWTARGALDGTAPGSSCWQPVFKDNVATLLVVKEG